MVTKTSSELELPLAQMDVFHIAVNSQAGKSDTNVGFTTLQLVRRRQHACVGLCRLERCFAGGRFPSVLLVLSAPCRTPAVKMRPLTLTVLGVLFGLDCLSAHRDGSAQKDGAAVPKKSPPHILFILIDDQVCVTEPM